ncbi:hypothetical protein, partial [Streptomyces sp. UNOB3_S3]|uniref:hypothetical protein n=1 Tax=Streptomyces sp. UNOB3_S3 TaxID=2871682 RepID=UPI001E64FD6A
MKMLINVPETVVADALRGMAAVHPAQLTRLGSWTGSGFHFQQAGARNVTEKFWTRSGGDRSRASER